jgi:hypothetical protein
MKLHTIRAKYVRTDVCMAMTIKSSIFWDAMPHSVIKFTDVTEEMHCLHLQG